MQHSLSNSEKARILYTKGVEASVAADNWAAIDYYIQALAIDSLFTFACDNLALAYRKTEQYEKAIEANKKSIAINPNATTPYQNLAIVYTYTKEFRKSILAYEELGKINANDPEVYYGMGRVVALDLHNNERGLQNMCKAYNLYSAIKSPFRVDAEAVLSEIYRSMKEDGEESKFFRILKENNINPNMEEGE